METTARTIMAEQALIESGITDDERYELMFGDGCSESDYGMDPDEDEEDEPEDLQDEAL